MALTAIDINDLKCTICFEPFECPKSLICGHSYCEQCAMKMMKKDQIEKYVIECPECRRNTIINSSGLPTNYSLLRLVEQFSRLNQITVTYSNLKDSEMENFVKRLVLKATDDTTDISDEQRAKMITERLNEKYGKHWICIIGNNTYDSWGILSLSCIKMERNDKIMTIFQILTDNLCWKCTQPNCNSIHCELDEPVIKETLMTESMTNEAKYIVMEALKSCSTSLDMAKMIKEHFDTKYGSSWQCFVSNEQCSSWLESEPMNYVMITVGKVTVELFKGRQNQNCWKCAKNVILCPDGMVRDTVPLNDGYVTLIDHNCQLTPYVIEETYKMENDLLESTKMVFKLTIESSNSVGDAVEVLKKYFEAEYGSTWACLVFTKKKAFEVSGLRQMLISDKKQYIWLKISEILYVLVFNSDKKSCCWKCNEVSCTGKECNLENPTVSSSDMKHSMAKEAQEVAVEMLKKYNTPKKVAEEITIIFDQKHPFGWQCAVKNVDYPSSHSINVNVIRKGHFIDLQISKVRVVLWKFKK